MDENFSGSFSMFSNSQNPEENAMLQNNRPNSQFSQLSSSPQFSSKFQNLPYAPQYPQNFSYPTQYPPNFQNIQYLQQYPPYMHLPQPPSAMVLDESRRASIGASRVEKELATPPSPLESQFPPHSTQVEVEKIDFNVDAEMGSKRTFWTVEEEQHLAKSYINISTDSAIGNSQKDKAFWKRIGDYYSETRP
ncbi:uncharacterized protein LOC122048245 [Zingiber officinale]|uniref:uncharacterized protein LOC122048245 n=1 Tax=Zingiber officinale TaxID=94328 RepID=UPI001C4B3523|nr:uncharacterized protein LOC122048245 [Zingiber officinale]